MNKLILLSLSIAMAVGCRSTESTNSGATASAAMIPQGSPSATEVLREYHQAMVKGDSIKARSLATGTALSIIEYRFYRSASDDGMQFTYGPENIIGDTCYIPMRARNAATRDPEQQGKAILVKVEGTWKVERIAIQR